MSRGFIISLILLAAIVAIFFFANPFIVRTDRHYLHERCKTEIRTLELAIIAFRNEYDGTMPTGAPANVVKILRGNNPRQIVFMELPSRKNCTNSIGEFLDSWGTPYEISIISSTNFFIRSAGPDKKFGTGDDISSSP